MRLDKYLWCVRLYKTRSLAINACKSGKVLHNGVALKPASECKLDMTLTIKNGAFKNEFRIIAFPTSRVAAKFVSDYMSEITSAELVERNKMIAESRKENTFYEFGKPSKKDRREIRKYKNL